MTNVSSTGLTPTQQKQLEQDLAQINKDKSITDPTQQTNALMLDQVKYQLDKANFEAADGKPLNSYQKDALAEMNSAYNKMLKDSKGGIYDKTLLPIDFQAFQMNKFIFNNPSLSPKQVQSLKGDFEKYEYDVKNCGENPFNHFIVDLDKMRLDETLASHPHLTSAQKQLLKKDFQQEESNLNNVDALIVYSAKSEKDTLETVYPLTQAQKDALNKAYDTVCSQYGDLETNYSKFKLLAEQIEAEHSKSQ